jgi:hypothetical protein
MARGRDSTVAPRRGGRAAAYGALGVLARVVDIVVAVVALIIAVGILLVVLEANPANDLVKAVLDAARWLVGPFRGIFTLDDRKLTVAVNWGLALVVYVVVGRLISGLLRRPRP